MIKNFLLYGLLLVLSFAASYFVSVPNKDSASYGVNWTNVVREKVRRVEYRSEGVTVFAEREGRSDQFWVQSEELELSTPSPSKVDAKVGAGQRKVTRFRPSKKFQDFLTSFEPLKAIRVVGGVDQLTLSDFGLEKDGQVFKIDDILHWRIGTRGYGTNNYYVLDLLKEQVILVAGGSLDDFMKASSRLFERSLLSIDLDEVDSLIMDAATKQKAINHKIREPGGALGWSDPGADKTKTAYKTWISKIEKLSALSYADPAKAAELREIPFFLKIDFRKGAAVSEYLEFRKVGKGAALQYWAFSSYLDAFVEVATARMDTIEKDIPSILAD